MLRTAPCLAAPNLLQVRVRIGRADTSAHLLCCQVPGLSRGLLKLILPLKASLNCSTASRRSSETTVLLGTALTSCILPTNAFKN